MKQKSPSAAEASSSNRGLVVLTLALLLAGPEFSALFAQGLPPAIKPTGGMLVGWPPFGYFDSAPTATNITAISAGAFHSLALEADGKVVGSIWSRDADRYGEVDPPAGLSNVVAVAAGYRHSLALKSDGRVLGWGRNDYGQVNVPSSATNIIAISGGELFSLALRGDRTVIAWGCNSDGQINVPANATNVVAIRAGNLHSLALRLDGTVVAWGNNGFGQINVPTSATNIAAIAVGGYHSLALTANGTVVAWGDDSWGQTDVPTGLSNVVAIAGGDSHSVALKAIGGPIVGWGRSDNGQIDFAVSATNFLAVAASGAYSLAVEANTLFIPAGGACTQSVVASGTPPLSFQWWRSGTAITGATRSQLVLSNASVVDTGVYVPVVTNLYGSATGGLAPVSVGYPPAITEQPSNQVLVANASAWFSVAATGSPPLSYQWSKNGLGLSGQTGQTLALSSVTIDDAGTYSVAVTSPYGKATSAQATLAIMLFFTVQPASQSVPVGSNAIFAATATGTPPLSYQWSKNGSNLFDGAGILGAASDTLMLAAVGTNDTADYTLVVSNTYGSVTSSVAALSVGFSPTILEQPSNAPLIAGRTATLEVRAAGTPPLNYQWHKNGIALTDQTSNTLIISPVVPGDAGSYSVLICSPYGCVTSSVAPLLVVNPPTILIPPASQWAASGNSVTFSVTATGDTSLAYQWRKGSTDLMDGGNISGAMTNALLLTAVTTNDAGDYTVVVFNPYCSVTSSVATLSVGYAPTITDQPASQAVLVSNAAVFSVTASGTVPLSYQWLRDGAPVSSGANSALTLDRVATNDTGGYVVVVTNAYGSATSSVATLVVLTPPECVATPPSQFVVVGNSATITATASGTAPLAYQWYFGGTAISGATGTNYTITSAATNDTGNYVVVVTNAYGSVTSSVATLAVGYPPGIAAQPTNQFAVTGGTATFSVTATGTSPLGYQWQKNGGPLAGQTNAALVLANVAASSIGDYAVVVSSPYGGVTSSVATLSIVLSIVAQPVGTWAVLGSNVTFGVTASGTEPLSYQWQKNSTNLSDGAGISGTTSNLLALTAVTTNAAGTYRVVVSNPYGSVTSSLAVLTVRTPPVITVQPISQSLAVGSAVILTVSATGTPTLYYQWRKNGTNLVNGGVVSGATTAAMTLTRVTTNESAGYAVVVTNAYGSVTSSTVNILVISPTLTGPMASARQSHTATLLPSGKVLVAGGYNGSYLSGAEVYNPATGTWASTGGMATARQNHSATLLPNGKVLVAGGYNGSYLSSAQLYDPASGTWTTTGMMNTARRYHTATLLPNGKVLVAGGYNGSYLSSAELFDPATGSWTTTGPLPTARQDHTATLLPNGKVLVAGGYNGSYLSSAALYDPAAATWATTGSLPTTRRYHTATMLPNGKVLAAGGYNGTSLSSAALYAPTTGTWTTTGSLSAARQNHTATLLPSGKLLVIGGQSGGAITNSAELYDQSAGTWTATSALVNARQSHTATLLPSGTVLTAGGAGSSGYLASAELYGPTSGTWTTTGALNTSHADHTATLLTNGKALVAMGDSYSSELYDPASGKWTMADGSLLSYSPVYHAATLLPSGKVLVSGGIEWLSQISYSTAGLYDPSTTTWTTTGSLNTSRCYHTATLLANGQVLVAGGWYAIENTGGHTLSSAEIYDPASGTWTVSGSLNQARDVHTATLLPNGKVLVAGGWTGSALLTSTELYDPATGRWTATGPMTAARQQYTATLLPNGKVLVAGGYGGSGGLASAELYDPASGTWTSTGSLNTARQQHTATLLPYGKVLVAAGYDPLGHTNLTSTELYDPANGTWAVTGPLTTARSGHTATLLPSGKLLIAGGHSNSGSSAEIYDVGLGFSAAWQPQISTVTSPLRYGSSLALTGSGFRGVSEGSSGSGQDSPGDYPLVQLRNLESGQTSFLLCTNWQTNSFASAPVWGFPPGYALATMFVNGIPSTSSILLVAKAVGSLVLGNLSQTYDGTPRTVSVTTTPPGLPVDLKYNGSTNAPTNAASYTIIATINDTNYQGSATNTLVISKATGIVTLSNLFQTYDGTAKRVTATTAPPGLVVNLKYNGSANAPTNVGSYTVIGTINNPNYQGSATSTLVITAPAPPAIILTGARVLSGGALQFGFTNTPGVSFSVLATTNLSLPLTNWTMLGGVTEISPGQFQFTDPQATNYPQRFYRVRSALSVGTVTTIVLANPTELLNGTFQFSFTNTPGASFSVLATTNLVLPLSNWTVLGAVTETSPGQFQFIDLQATNSQNRFYRIRSP